MEYKFVTLNTPRCEDKTNIIAGYRDEGWRVHSVNQDFTMALLERETKAAAISPAVGVAPVPHDIRVTDSFPVLNIETHTVTAQPMDVRVIYSQRPKDTREDWQRGIEHL